MKQVLVIDDSPVIRKITRRILEGMRLQTSEASDGRQALAACSFMMPAAIFVDSSMPGPDGCDFLPGLRQMPGGERPKVVFCSTERKVSLIARAMHAGADEFLVKPFDRKAVETKFTNIGVC